MPTLLHYFESFISKDTKCRPIWTEALEEEELKSVQASIPLTYMHSHSAALRADVGAGECEWFPAHLTEASHEGMVRDTDAHQLEGT